MVRFVALNQNETRFYYLRPASSFLVRVRALCVSGFYYYACAAFGGHRLKLTTAGRGSVLQQTRKTRPHLDLHCPMMPVSGGRLRRVPWCWKVKAPRCHDGALPPPAVMKRSTTGTSPFPLVVWTPQRRALTPPCSHRTTSKYYIHVGRGWERSSRKTLKK